MATMVPIVIVLYCYIENGYSSYVVCACLQEFTTHIVAETHEQWKKLIKNEQTGETNISR